MKPVHALLTCTLAAALASVSAHAQTTQNVPAATGTQQGQMQQGQTQQGQTQQGQTQQGQTLAQDDQTFLENAAQGSYAEIEGSRLAQEKGTSQDVKNFAAMMIKDHGKMAEDVAAVAAKKGVEIPREPSALQTTEITALKALSGGAFDAMYINRIGVASHEATVEMFEEASQQAQDPDVKALATQALPKLREHLELARQINEKQEKQ